MTINHFSKLFTVAFAIALVGFSACKKEDEQEEQRKALLNNYASIVLAAYEDSYSAAEKLLLQLAQERTSIALLKENAIVNSNFYTPQNVLSRLESSSL